MTTTGRRLVALATALAFGVLSSAIVATAQQPGRVYRIGMLCPTQCVPTHSLFQPFMQGLRDFGWVEGQNLILEFRNALGRSDQMATLARELVEAKPDLLVGPSPAAAHALKNATRTIPIVFLGVGDPVHSGFVASLARPGGNMTGLTISAGPEVPAKRLELLHRAVPRAKRIAVLLDPVNEPTGVRDVPVLEGTARSLGLEVLRIDSRQPDDLEPAVAMAVEKGAGALLVLASPMMTAHARRIGEAAMRHRLPAMTYTDLSASGYVLTYGPSFVRIFRRSGYYIDKILRGATPGDLPVERPKTYELVVDLRTATAIGLTIPPSLVVQADRVIP